MFVFIIFIKLIFIVYLFAFFNHFKDSEITLIYFRNWLTYLHFILCVYFFWLLFSFYYNPTKSKTPSSLNHGFTDTNFISFYFYDVYSNFMFVQHRLCIERINFCKQKQSFSCRYTNFNQKFKFSL